VGFMAFSRRVLELDSPPEALRVLHQDGRRVLRAGVERYDLVVVVDLLPSLDHAQPKRFYSREGLADLVLVLDPDDVDVLI